ncbi:IclR family transcriptional regulator [Planobispora rosea]|uniref:IclR family transcriptional regulator n=1 Tax=Planobispora rosea TaxID=35762 RepID=A0A8J3RUU7_PLARO|nr:IclR family transcriptional regulator [Planobispora rosea]GGS47361.1 IclR family transcriptional regulator [Planobispora rosea]GIH82222.1 IclR family transcriptional regulator [Planobispora rosea]
MTTPSGTQAIDRAAQLLVRVVEAGEPQPFTTLLTESGLPKSTASRLLSALERHGLLQRDRDGAFRPGPVLARYASRSGSADLAVTAQPYLERIGGKTGETVNLAVLSGGAVEQIAQVDSSYLLGATNWVGLRVPLHCSALGKVFLAHGAAELPGGPLERRTPRTLTDREELGRELAGIRRRGYGVAREELEPGLIAVAAAVRGGDGAVIAALSVSGPSVRLTPDRVTEIGELLTGEASALSEALGAPFDRARDPAGPL